MFKHHSTWMSLGKDKYAACPHPQHVTYHMSRSLMSHPDTQDLWLSLGMKPFCDAKVT